MAKHAWATALLLAVSLVLYVAGLLTIEEGFRRIGVSLEGVGGVGLLVWLYFYVRHTRKEIKSLREQFVDASEKRRLSRALKDHAKGLDGLIHMADTATRDEANLQRTRDIIKAMIQLFAMELQGTQWEDELGFYDPHGPYRNLDSIGLFFSITPLPGNIERGYKELVGIVETTKDRISAIVSDIDGRPTELDFRVPNPSSN